MISKTKHSPILAGVIFLVASSFLSGCGGGLHGGPGAAANPMKITPSSTTPRAGDSLQFSATITGTTNQAVTWPVNGAAGGNATVGTIDAEGMYKAPGSVPTPMR